MTMLVYAVAKPELPPFEMPDRFRMEVTYFMTPAGKDDVPDKLGLQEYWVRLEDARRWVEDLTVELVSPLDSENKTEIELTEEQEAWLDWMVTNEIEHIRLEKKT